MTGVVVLAATGVLIVVVGLLSARVPPSPLPDRDGYFAAWGELHGGYDPRGGLRIVRMWLGFAYRLGRPLAGRGIQPDVVTLTAVWATAALLLPAAAGGRWPLLAAAVVIVSGLLDNLDGAVAVLTGRTSAWGYLLDSLADRACDAIYLVALWLAGAPGWLALAAAAAVVSLEYTRARAGNAGFGSIGVVTVGERPTRVIVTAMFLLLAGVAPRYASWAAGLGAAATLATALAGLAQLLWVLRGALSTRSAPG